jgi:hypothetical protein
VAFATILVPSSTGTWSPSRKPLLAPLECWLCIYGEEPRANACPWLKEVPLLHRATETVLYRSSPRVVSRVSARA